jgi:glucose/arabinose dehydrogenase
LTAIRLLPVVLLLVPLGGAAQALPARDGAVPAGFRQEIVVAGLDRPTAFAFLPDGRILIAEHAGRVKVAERGRLKGRPFLDITRRVDNELDRGLMAIAADPDFLRNGFVYLYYAYEGTRAGPTTMRLTRVTARGDIASPQSEVVLLGGIPADCRCHTGGDIGFGSDASLFLSTGDAARAGGANRNALRAQRLDSLAGKVLRVTRTGLGLPTNPFWTGDPRTNRSKVWAYGLRNAFRFDLRPGDDVPYVGDVGWRAWEEIDIARRGTNFGWPCYEGPARQAAYASQPICAALYRAGPRATSPPLYAYRRPRSGASVTGGAFATGAAYPPEYRGVYFFGDFIQDWIRYLQVDGDGKPASPRPFVSGGDGPVAIETGRDGNLYYLALEAGELRRVRSLNG